MKPIDSHNRLGSIAAATTKKAELYAGCVAATAQGIAGNTDAPAGCYGPKVAA
jgi:hypothetical protein